MYSSCMPQSTYAMTASLQARSPTSKPHAAQAHRHAVAPANGTPYSYAIVPQRHSPSGVSGTAPSREGPLTLLRPGEMRLKELCWLSVSSPPPRGVSRGVSPDSLADRPLLRCLMALSRLSLVDMSLHASQHGVQLVDLRLHCCGLAILQQRGSLCA